MLGRLKILALAACTVAALAAGATLAEARQPSKPAPAAAARTVSTVMDGAGALDALQLKELRATVALNELRSGVQVTVAIVPTLNGMTADAYAATVLEKYKIGLQNKPAVLFFVAVQEKAATIAADRRAEATLSRKAQRAIIERIVLANFRLGKVNTGIYDGTRAITLALQVPYITQAAQVEDGGLSKWLPLLVLGVFLVGFGNSDWNRGYYGGGRYGGRGRTY